jgi:5,10-methylenetetrahydrofolate reductase
MADDKGIRQHISDLVAEERELRRALSRHEIEADDEHARLQAIERELDQCWDLLRQRRALREAHLDPEGAHVRQPEVVERYEQ